MAKKRFLRKTKGYNAQVFVAKAINYTDDTTYAAFIANAPVGEFGVFDGNLAIHNNLITSAEDFFFAIRTTEGVKKTQNFRLSDFSVSPIRKKTYTAPVKQISFIGYNGSSGGVNGVTIAAGQNYNVKIIETTEGFEPFPTWNYEYTTKPGDTIVDVLRYIAKKMNDDSALEHIQNSRLLSVKLKADATYGNFALTGTTPTLTFTQGSDVVTVGGTTPTHDVATGDYLSIDSAAAPTDAIGDIYKVRSVPVANGSIYLDRPFTGTTVTLTEAQAEGTRLKKVTAFGTSAVGLEMTTVDNDTTFRIAANDEMRYADITYSTAATQSNGTSDQVADIEREGKIFYGETAINTQFASKYGQQDTFTVDGETYDFYHFDAIKTTSGIGTQIEYKGRSNVVIAVAKSTGNVDTTLDTLFAL